MNTYIVAFEVFNDDRKENLKTKLREYGTYCPINDNCWAIVSEDTAIQIRDNLNLSLVASDRIFVIRSGVIAAWRNVYSDDNSKWLKERL